MNTYQSARRYENNIVKLLKTYNVNATRIPLSGSKSVLQCDIHTKCTLESFLEIKSKKTQLKRLNKLLTTENVVICKHSTSQKEIYATTDTQLFIEWIQRINNQYEPTNVNNYIKCDQPYNWIDFEPNQAAVLCNKNIQKNPYIFFYPLPEGVGSVTGDGSILK